MAPPVPYLHVIKRVYWTFAGVGALWAVFIALLIHPTIQRHGMYAHKIQTGFWHNVSEAENFGFARGQVTPFHLNTSDGETLFCWHVMPLDVYLENENEVVQGARVGVVEDLKETVGAKLLRRDPESRVVVNFHGNAGHIAQGYRPSTYRSLTGIPRTHVLTCDYRGFGESTLRNAPHVPTETGLITDSTTLISYVLTSLQHPAERTVLLGQSLGTAVTAASALYFTDPTSDQLPSDLTPPTSGPKIPAQSFAGVVLVATFPDLPILVQSYKILGFIPILSPLRAYPRVLRYLSTKVVDTWPTQDRLLALLSASKTLKTPVHLTILHARNDMEIDFRLSEGVYNNLEAQLKSDNEKAVTISERKSVLGAEKVSRGAFAYRKVEEDGRLVELELTRFGGHNEIVGLPQVSLSVRRAFARSNQIGKVGLDVE